jgi:hypothetical protein
MFIELHVPLYLICPREAAMHVDRSCRQPQYKQQNVLRAYNTDGYFSSAEAIRAMQEIVRECQRVEKISMLNLTYTKSMVDQQSYIQLP